MTEAEAIQRARNLYADDDLEIDDSPNVILVKSETQADPGFWVAAWVWVADETEEDAE